MPPSPSPGAMTYERTELCPSTASCTRWRAHCTMSATRVRRLRGMDTTIVRRARDTKNPKAAATNTPKTTMGPTSTSRPRTTPVTPPAMVHVTAASTATTQSFKFVETYSEWMTLHQVHAKYPIARRPSTSHTSTTSEATWKAKETATSQFMSMTSAWGSACASSWVESISRSTKTTYPNTDKTTYGGSNTMATKKRPKCAPCQQMAFSPNA